MKKLLLICLLITFSSNSLYAQKELSKKEKRELKKQKKIKNLEFSINTPQIRFSADKMIPPTGVIKSGRGGILFLKGNDGEFMEFLITNLEGKEQVTSTSFKVINYTVLGTFKDQEIKLSFSANANKDKKYYVTITIKPSGKSVLILKDAYSTTTYYGRTTKI